MLLIAAVYALLHRRYAQSGKSVLRAAENSNGDPCSHWIRHTAFSLELPLLYAAMAPLAQAAQTRLFTVFVVQMLLVTATLIPTVLNASVTIDWLHGGIPYDLGVYTADNRVAFPGARHSEQWLDMNPMAGVLPHACGPRHVGYTAGGEGRRAQRRPQQMKNLPLLIVILRRGEFGAAVSEQLRSITIPQGQAHFKSEMAMMEDDDGRPWIHRSNGSHNTQRRLGQEDISCRGVTGADGGRSRPVPERVDCRRMALFHSG